jgi:RHS repeat-associated protein
MAGISSKAAGKLENRRKFNDGTELNTDFDLNWYETDFRSYDPQIGRFHQIDELTEFDFDWSPYVYCHNNPILLNDPLGLTADSTAKPGPDDPTPGSKLAEVKFLDEVVVTAKKKSSSVGQPGTLESFIPVWGAGRAAVDDFQNGRWGWGIFNSVMVVADVFTLGAASTLVKGGVKLVAKEGVYLITTRSGRYIGQSKNFLKRIAQHFGKNGKLSGQQLQKALLHEMPGSTKLEREVYEQYLIDKNGLDNLINAVNPMGGRRELFNQMIDGVIEKFGLPK